ncbi:MAG: hypothetical protein NC397_08200 [Clostridium sp.]|nr:hypothetical protein [Clostridium sp.]
MKYFEFKYINNSSEHFENFGYKLTNFLLPIVPSIIVISILYHTPISNYWWFSIFTKVLLFICFIIAIVLVYKFNNNPRGVFLYDDYIDIDRQSVSYWHLSKRNFKINISDIKYCKEESKDFSNYGDRYYNTMGGTGYPFVMIRLHNNHTFCFCIENQEEFVKEVNQKIVGR